MIQLCKGNVFTCVPGLCQVMQASVVAHVIVAALQCRGQSLCEGVCGHQADAANVFGIGNGV